MTYQPPPGGQQWPQQQPWGQPPPQGYPPPGQPPHGQPPHGRKSWPARHKVLTVTGGVFGAFVLLGVIGAVTGGNHPSAGAPAVAGTAAAASAATRSPAAARPAVRTVATFTGSGIQNTPRFTVTATWKLVYSFNCSAFGQAGNFAVSEDGGSDFNGVSVNDLAMSKSASTWGYSDAGTHFLAIDSECSWKVRVVDEP